MYVFIQTEPGVWSVGFYQPDGTFYAESDYNDHEAAAMRVHYLNGGK